MVLLGASIAARGHRGGRKRVVQQGGHGSATFRPGGLGGRRRPVALGRIVLLLFFALFAVGDPLAAVLVAAVLLVRQLVLGPRLERVLEHGPARAVVGDVPLQLSLLLGRQQQRLQVGLQAVGLKVLPDERKQLVRFRRRGRGGTAARLRELLPQAAAGERQHCPCLAPHAEHEVAPRAADVDVPFPAEQVAVRLHAPRLPGGGLGAHLVLYLAGLGLLERGRLLLARGVVGLAEHFHLAQHEVLRDPVVQALRVERPFAAEHHGGHAVLQGFGHVLDARLDVLHPILAAVGEVEREVPGVQDLRQRHLGPRRRDHGGGRRDGADERRELVELRLAVGLRDEVDLVEDDDVGELELVDEERRDVAVVLRLLRLGIDRGDGVDAPHVLLEGARVDDGDAVVERALRLQLPLLGLDEEGLGHLHRLRDPAALDEHAVVLAGR
mmetsp:Transcript_16244/g.50427  ORF Transcript_16244/g.50427 Transcript_16244/m.50427 type:complete len:440 (+) Transcript_16244:14-1333(+)